MLIALFPNEQKKLSFDIACQIRDFLSKRGVAVTAEDEKAAAIGAIPLSKVKPSDIRFLISMGGDGTLLRIAHRFNHLKAPILGINLGQLGFMADVPIEDIIPSLTDLLAGAYKIDQRLMIECHGPNGKILRAANDIVFHRAQNYSLIKLAIHVDGIYVNTFLADGIIIATPNGSTAYSLAAGGPILSPALDAIVLTPISPHTISNRPFVLTSDHEIQVEYLSSYNPIDVRADGLDAIALPTNGKVIVKKSSETFQLVNLDRREYFATLRTKLGWSGKLSSAF